MVLLHEIGAPDGSGDVVDSILTLSRQAANSHNASDNQQPAGLLGYCKSHLSKQPFYFPNFELAKPEQIISRLEIAMGILNVHWGLCSNWSPDSRYFGESNVHENQMRAVKMYRQPCVHCSFFQ